MKVIKVRMHKSVKVGREAQTRALNHKEGRCHMHTCDHGVLVTHVGTKMKNIIPWSLIEECQVEEIADRATSKADTAGSKPKSGAKASSKPRKPTI